MTTWPESSRRDPLTALRQATATQHAVLDAALAIGRPGADAHAYAAHLALLEGWLAPLETWLAGFDDGPFGPAGLPFRARLPLIVADLDELQAAGIVPAASPARGRQGKHDVSQASPGRLPDAGVAEWPVDASAAYRWGVAYVMEGSQLGGAVLYQQLKLALAPLNLAYLRGDAAGPGPRWRDFMLALRSAVCTRGEIEDACRGARDAFARITCSVPDLAGADAAR